MNLLLQLQDLKMLVLHTVVRTQKSSKAIEDAPILGR